MFVNGVILLPGVNKLRKGFVMTEAQVEFKSEQYVRCFDLPNCSLCKHFELMGVFEYCNLHETITDGKLCNGFRIKNANA